MDENKTPLQDETEEKEISPSSEEKEKNDPLASFLKREEAKDKERFSAKKDDKKTKIPWYIAIPVVVVIILGVVLLILKLNPAKEDEETSSGAAFEATVDEMGFHQAIFKTDEGGALKENGSGTLISCATADVREVTVTGKTDSFTVTARTEKTTNDDGEEEETTVYTLMDYEDFELREGAPEALANDAATVGFTTVAGADVSYSDFGIGEGLSQAEVFIRYSDDTKARLCIGADAPASAGIYYTLGDESGKLPEKGTVYLAESEALDSFLYKVTDLISLSVSSTAEDVDSSQFSSIEISGSHYDQTIVMEPNDDDAINSGYLMTAPKKMICNTTESADIAGAVRGVYAEEVLCVKPSEKELSDYGLSDPYARIKAVYPDTVIELFSSAPDEEGNVWLTNADKKVVYSIQLGAVEWANTSIEKLSPDVVLDINKEKVKNITVTAGGVTYSLDVTTTAETQTNDDGEEEEVKKTTASYNGKDLTEENFASFFQNLTAMKLLSEEGASEDVLCEIRISYTTDRMDDVITVMSDDNAHLPIKLNGEYIGAVYRNYINQLLDSLQDLISGKTVNNI